MQEVGVSFRTQTKGLLHATSLHKMCVRKDNGRTRCVLSFGLETETKVICYLYEYCT